MDAGGVHIPSSLALVSGEDIAKQTVICLLAKDIQQNINKL